MRVTAVIVCAALCAASQLAHGSMPLAASLEDLACGADHVFLGHVEKVALVDSAGRTRQKGMTGPGLGNRIWLAIVVDELIESTASDLPRTIQVPLDPFMHYSVEEVREVHRKHAGPYLVLLAGAQPRPVVEGNFLLGPEARERVLTLREACRTSPP